MNDDPCDQIDWYQNYIKWANIPKDEQGRMFWVFIGFIMGLTYDQNRERISHERT